jgi:hypothetical protein
MQTDMHSDGIIIGVISTSCMFGVGALWIVCHYVFLCWKQWQATNLIRAMMERGYTPQEVTQILQVLGHKTKSSPEALLDVPPAKPIKQPAYAANY